jgi:hypothetical protein
MKSLILVLIAGLCACSTSVEKDITQLQMPTGSWKGKLNQISTKKLSGWKDNINYDLVVQSCNGITEFWISEDSKKYVKPYADFKLQSISGTLLFSVMKDGGSWIETQTWTLVLVNDKRASIQWNRMVSNPKLSDNEELRSFGEFGYGEITKIRDTCDLIKKNS